MSKALQSRLNDLTSSFASAVLDTLKGATLRDLQTAADGGARGAESTRAAPKSTRAATAKPARARSSGRLPRRSPQAIASALEKIVTLVKKRKEGLRAEQIRQELGMLAKELPRVLKEGLSTRMLRSKGQKRATTYFAK
jgi:hypothetical protein